MPDFVADETAGTAPADKAVAHVLAYIRSEPRAAYYLGPFTQSLRLLATAYATANSLDAETFHREFQAKLKTAPPLETRNIVHALETASEALKACDGYCGGLDPAAVAALCDEALTEARRRT